MIYVCADGQYQFVLTVLKVLLDEIEGFEVEAGGCKSLVYRADLGVVVQEDTRMIQEDFHEIGRPVVGD